MRSGNGTAAARVGANTAPFSGGFFTTMPFCCVLRHVGARFHPRPRRDTGRQKGAVAPPTAPCGCGSRRVVQRRRTCHRRAGVGPSAPAPGPRMHVHTSHTAVPTCTALSAGPSDAVSGVRGAVCGRLRLEPYYTAAGCAPRAFALSGLCPSQHPPPLFLPSPVRILSSCSRCTSR